MQQLTDYYIMLIDGRCQVVSAATKTDALVLAAKLFQFRYEWEDLFDDDSEFDNFISNVNYIEWKDDTYRHLENYMELAGNKRFQKFPADTPYFLSEYVNLKLTE